MHDRHDLRAPNRRPPRESPDSRYNRILDAAEAKFAALGFYGASLRAIADLAGIKLSLTTYHFGSKEELFNQVVLRRAAEHVARIQLAMDDVQLKLDEDGTASIEDLIRSYVAPLISALRMSEGWRNYVQLLARAVSGRQDELFLAETLRVYDPVRLRFVSLAKRILPRTDEDHILWGTYFLNSALEPVLTENRSLDRLSSNKLTTSDLDMMLERFAGFFGAGFRSDAAARAT